MDATLKTIILFSSVLLTGLSAGLFYAWSVSVIPGTKKVDHATYLEAMQAINRAILNPAFFLIFIGSLVGLSMASIYHLHAGKATFWFMLSATILYLAGTVGVTGLGNVPLNNKLDALELPQLTTEKLAQFRAYYETSWNRLHQIRTVFAVAAFALSLVAVFTHTQKL